MSFTPSNFRQIKQLFGFSILKNTFVNKYCWTVNTKEMESLKTVKDLGYDFNAGMRTIVSINPKHKHWYPGAECRAPGSLALLRSLRDFD